MSGDSLAMLVRASWRSLTCPRPRTRLPACATSCFLGCTGAVTTGRRQTSRGRQTESTLSTGELRGDSTLRRPRQAPDEQRDEAPASPGFCEEEHEYTRVSSLQLPSQRQPNYSEQPRCASRHNCFGLSCQSGETA